MEHAIGMLVFVVVAISALLWTAAINERKSGALRGKQEEAARRAEEAARRAEDDLRAAFAKEQKEHDEWQDAIKGVIKPHLPVLERKKRQLITQDDYGVYKTDAWVRELDYFAEHVLQLDEEKADWLRNRKELFIQRMASEYAPRDLPPDLVDSLTVPWFEQFPIFSIWGMVDDYALEHLHDQETLNPDDVVTGTDYEVFCAARLEALGWSVIRRGGSGDQGVDLIGTLSWLNVVFQCKYYSKPVGNAAVQEVIAGMTFEGSSFGAVIASNGFTEAARQLANTADVELLHHDDLEAYTDGLRRLIEKVDEKRLRERGTYSGHALP